MDLKLDTVLAAYARAEAQRKQIIEFLASSQGEYGVDQRLVALNQAEQALQSLAFLIEELTDNDNLQK